MNLMSSSSEALNELAAMIITTNDQTRTLAFDVRILNSAMGTEAARSTKVPAILALTARTSDYQLTKRLFESQAAPEGWVL